MPFIVKAFIARPLERLIINSYYFIKVMSSEIRRFTQARENTKSFVQIFFPDSSSDLKYYGTIAIEKLQNLEIGEEVYIDYSSEYSFL